MRMGFLPAIQFAVAALLFALAIGQVIGGGSQSLFLFYALVAASNLFFGLRDLK